MDSPARFFEMMEEAGGPQHAYVGELYFSAHRGVYTSQAAIKKGNRKSELALREAEMWGALAIHKGFTYPLSRMDAAWKRLLLNQFHDILPGSSIARVYEEARKDHKWIISEAEHVLGDAINVITQGEGVTVFNSLSFEREELIMLPEAFAQGARTADGAPVPVNKIANGVLALVAAPACGAVSLVPACTTAEQPSASAKLTSGGAVLENNLIRAVFNNRAEVISYIDKQTGREYAAKPMNRLLLFKDVPRLFDAWDIDSNYALQPVDINEPVTLSVREATGLRAVITMERTVSNSVITQEIILAANSRRIDFVTHVIWNELHRLLKVSFPVAVEATEAINEIQYGYLTRPAHRSRSYDNDRFEVCQQRYSALCDQTHGVAILNDCKYGISQLGNEMQLTLLRAAACPEMRADNGEHDFTYAFTAWEGPFADSPVVKEAYALNVPLHAAPGKCFSFSAFSLNKENIFIDTVKPAEDGSGDTILRLYEAKKGDTNCILSIGIPAVIVWDCDMLENKQSELTLQNCKVRLHFHPFEVKTLRIKK
jgi:alpha-mannosidase